jgi:hypothetical protein
MNIGQYEDLASEPGIERLYFEIPIGATGAPGTAVRLRGLNRTTPLTRTGVGVYTLNLAEGVDSIVDWNIQTQSAGITNTTALRSVVTTRTPSGASPLVGFTMVNTATGAATEITSGDTLVGYVAIKNTNA